MPGIGLLNEKHLHASLKQWYARPGDRFEVPVDGFVIDIVRDDLLIEIQTRNLSAIKSKLTKLLHSHRVRLLYPIVQEKWIVREAKGRRDELTRRKSPKRGRWEDLFSELVSIPQLLSHSNFSLEVLMIKGRGIKTLRRQTSVAQERMDHRRTAVARGTGAAIVSISGGLASMDSEQP